MKRRSEKREPSRWKEISPGVFEAQLVKRTETPIPPGIERDAAYWTKVFDNARVSAQKDAKDGK